MVFFNLISSATAEIDNGPHYNHETSFFNFSKIFEYQQIFEDRPTDRQHHVYRRLPLSKKLGSKIVILENFLEQTKCFGRKNLFAILTPLPPTPLDLSRNGLIFNCGCLHDELEFIMVFPKIA